MTCPYSMDAELPCGELATVRVGYRPCRGCGDADTIDFCPEHYRIMRESLDLLTCEACGYEGGTFADEVLEVIRL